MKIRYDKLRKNWKKECKFLSQYTYPTVILLFHFLFFILFYLQLSVEADFLVLEDDSGRLGLGGKIINDLAPSTVTGRK